MSIFLIWSELYKGRNSEPLSNWVISEPGHQYYNELLEALASPMGINEMASLLGALKSFLLLYTRGRREPPARKIEILDLDLSKGDDLVARLDHMIWSFRSVALVDGTDIWKELLGQVKRPKDGDGRLGQVYWEYRLQEPRSHQEATQMLNGLQLDPCGTIKYHESCLFSVEYADTQDLCGYPMNVLRDFSQRYRYKAAKQSGVGKRAVEHFILDFQVSIHLSHVISETNGSCRGLKWKSGNAWLKICSCLH